MCGAVHTSVWDDDARLVMKVLPHAGQVRDDLDLELLEKSSRPNAGQLQYLRRVHRAGSEVDFSRGRDRRHIPTFARKVLDADSPCAVEDDTGDGVLGENVVVWPHVLDPIVVVQSRMAPRAGGEVSHGGEPRQARNVASIWITGGG